MICLLGNTLTRLAELMSSTSFYAVYFSIKHSTSSAVQQLALNIFEALYEVVYYAVL